MIATPILSFHARLKDAFGSTLQLNAPLAGYTASRIGGSAEGLLIVHKSEELERAVSFLWDEGIEFTILGGGSNVLISDRGVSGLVIVNRTRQYRFLKEETPPTLLADSGANFGALARAAARQGFGGLEWAAGIPGTLGGAVFGNAGAHDGDTAGNLLWADVLKKGVGKLRMDVDQMEYGYRGSGLQGAADPVVILAAKLQLEHQSSASIRDKMDSFLEKRRTSQPPGASMGSMFKNPPGDFAGRLIDQAGLKGTRVGEVEISSLHANFFVNLGAGNALAVLKLIANARQAVAAKFGVSLELEIELLGNWSAEELELVA